ncbi:helix-turn-helix transcriptional regulator [Geobacillus subterraneus]|uniref:Helix-turn-helix transcriptional regulator n=2 Tax=Geobacillus TaxID=129337 RepID=A0ABN4NDI8_9BACL|nr:MULTISPECIES: response regulator transcription factor [Geobacillus]AMX82617.1 helix-turn-helix transcriptional regulator [Geobacillus subterraneus]KZS26301.1 helix-turn-helix transcriptional regulator [Geobacillus subterraneus]OXB90708.1 LuxR family transcriptional regulator [Geobacillus uzenensis]
MNLRLSSRLDAILKEGWNVIEHHRDSILSAWLYKYGELEDKQHAAAQPLRLAIDAFSSRWIHPMNDIAEWLASFRREWEKRNGELSSNQSTAILSMMENAVHEAIQSDGVMDFRVHQAIQYVFLKLHESVNTSDCTEFDLEQFLEQIVSSKQLPIAWIAQLVRTANGLFIVAKWYGNAADALIDSAVYGETIFALCERILSRMDTSRTRLIPLPWGDDLLLVCTEGEDRFAIPFLLHALEQFHAAQKTFIRTKEQHLWKDAVLLFDQWIMRAKSLYQAIEYISTGFVAYLPFERCALFAYSSTHKSGFGLYGYQLDNHEIKSIHEHIDNLPFIKRYIHQMTNVPPIYIRHAEQALPMKYVKQFQLESIVIAPIYAPSENRLIGVAILDCGPKTAFQLPNDLYTAMMKFGQSAGEILAKCSGGRPELVPSTPHLSPREIEVLKLVAEGASTYETAKRLHLSEYTVRDYVSAILQKMNAKNRTEAIVKAIRDGII